MSSSRIIRDFIIGGLFGYAFERLIGSNNPSLFSLPFRPIWGLAAVLSSRDVFFNAYMSVVLEIIGHSLFPVWNFESEGAGAIAHGAVYIPYTCCYAIGMLVYRILADGPDAAPPRIPQP